MSNAHHLYRQSRENQKALYRVMAQLKTGQVEAAKITLEQAIKAVEEHSMAILPAKKSSA